MMHSPYSVYLDWSIYSPQNSPFKSIDYVSGLFAQSPIYSHYHLAFRVCGFSIVHLKTKPILYYALSVLHFFSSLPPFHPCFIHFPTQVVFLILFALFTLPKHFLQFFCFGILLMCVHIILVNHPVIPLKSFSYSLFSFCLSVLTFNSSIQFWF